MPRNPSPSQQAAARRNGRRGGRPRKAAGRDTAPAVADLLAALKLERLANLKFLLDLRDGLFPDATLADRVRAVESMLDRDPETARARGEYDASGGAPTGAPPKLFQLGDAEEVFEPPPGWSEKPVSEQPADPSTSAITIEHPDGHGDA